MIPTRLRRPVLVAALIAVIALALALVAGFAGGSAERDAAAVSKVTGDPDSFRGEERAQERALPGNPSAEALGGPVTGEEQELLDRAYPATALPFELTKNARKSFGGLKGRGFGDDKHAWQLAGPSTAIYPAVLNRTDADYIASGRITALAIAPTCTAGNCRVWIAAAGGGIWRTDDALATSPSWSFRSDDFGTNAIGTLTYDSAHNTLYAGTGEPNASGDSEAGVGIYKSTDGGDSWTLLPGSPAATNARAISSIVVDPANENTIYVGTARGVRGVSSVTGGSVSLAPDAPPWGLYKSTDGGGSFTEVWDAHGSIRGVNHVELATNGDLYAAAFQQGIWRSSNGGGSWEQVFATQAPTANTARTEFALTVAAGHTRIYAGDGGNSPATIGLYRVDNADVAASSLTDGTANPGWKLLTSADRTNPYYATYNYCTGQCWYDNFVVTPAGHPEVVYVGGSYDYTFAGTRDNGKAVLYSTDAGEHFADQTRDAGKNGIHPDQHALVVSSSNPALFFEGSDGGIVRSSGSLADISSQCDSRPLSPASIVACKNLLAAVPSELTSLNAGLSTLQFQSVSVNPTNSSDVQGGTQDNGTWEGTAGNQTWNQIIYGDGGQSGFDVGDPSVRFNNFFSPYSDVNFANGDPTKWVVVSAPFFNGTGGNPKEASAFYLPEIADPLIAGTQLIGLQHVWRTTDNGGDRGYLEANCPEFTTDGSQEGCGDWKPLGDPTGSGSLITATGIDYAAGDLTGPQYGADRGGGYVVATERATSDHSTLWAATRTGRVFISRNVDASDAGSVAFTRLDSLSSASPGRFVSSIAIDPKNPYHAWLSYSGYNANTPDQPGHVFEVTYDPKKGTATWENIDRGTGPIGDLPVTDLVHDDQTNALYAATDFGVLRSVGKSGKWTLAASGLPAVEVPGLTLDSKSRVLYAATHGRAVWSLQLAGSGSPKDPGPKKK